jgi:FkbM family methyltransferase
MPSVFRRLPIFLGPLRGKRWMLAAGGKVTRIMLGSYEPQQTALFKRHIRPGDVLLDAGAAAGYYTLLGSYLVGARGMVISIEPDPRNVNYLRQHVSANRLENVTIHPCALGSQQGIARFARGSGTGTGHLSERGELEVEIRRLDDIVASQAVTPTHLKIDVEGAELQVLEGAMETLRRTRPTIFLSTHSNHLHQACCRLLTKMNYTLEPILCNDVESNGEVLCRAA